MSMLPDVFVPSSQWSWNIDLIGIGRVGEMRNLKCSQRILRTALCAWISLLST